MLARGRAEQAEAGREADQCPSDWREGAVIPLWGQKAANEDPNIYRGVAPLGTAGGVVSNSGSGGRGGITFRGNSEAEAARAAE